LNRAARIPQRLFAAGIGAMILVGGVARVLVWVSSAGIPDSDEAVGGLMAKHALAGDFSVFYWGQGYGGPVETWLAAPVIALVGDSWVGLRMIPILISALTAIAVWRLGLRTIGRWGAATAGAICWTFPSHLVWRSIHFHIFYASEMLLAAAALLLIVRVRESASRRDVALLGLVVGVGLWQSFQLAAIFPAAIGWLLVRRRDVFRLAPFAVPGLLAGAVPVLVSNVRHSWWSFHIGEIGIQSTYVSRIGTFFTNTLPMSLDLRASCTLHWFIWKPIGLVLYAIAIALFLVLAWRARRTNRAVLFLVVGVFPLISAISQLTGVYASPGYVDVLIPVLLLALCAWISTPLQGLWAMGAAVILLSGAFIDFKVNESSVRAVPFCPVSNVATLPRDFGPLIHRLNDLGVPRLYASYWIAYRLDFETGEKIVAAEGRPDALRLSPQGGVIPKPDDPSLHPRWPMYDEIVGHVAAPVWVIAKNFDVGNIDYGAFSQAGYRSEDVGPFTIYYRGATGSTP
jgi:4-amino-4-deoxy-L-arabinose transferase-like glycosyltransferase